MRLTGGARKAGGRFFGVFPIRTKLKSWGAFSCIANAPRRLSAEDIDLIASMCSHVAVAIENASLFQSTADKADELAMLYSVVGDCMRISDVTELLHGRLVVESKPGKGSKFTVEMPVSIPGPGIDL